MSPARCRKGQRFANIQGVSYISCIPKTLHTPASLTSRPRETHFAQHKCSDALRMQKDSSTFVRPLEPKAETQPQLQPALLRLSAMITQYLHAQRIHGCFFS